MDLPNRFEFEKVLDRELSRSKRNHTMVALMCLDLDNFNSVNQAYGKAMGDKVLAKVAEILQSKLRKEEVVAHLGSDEFAVLITDVKDIANIDTVAQKLQDVLEKPLLIDGDVVMINFCMGIAISPLAGDNPSTLIKHAEMALFTAKAGGRDCFRYYSPEINKKSERHLQIAACLQTALMDNEFYLNYKPVYDLHNNKLVAVEAVLNWYSNEIGQVPLSEFIPVAKEVGVMGAISHWELTNACSALASWDFKNFHLYITITKVQFESEDFVSYLSSLVKELSLKPELVILKVAEELISDINQYHQKKLEELSKGGFSISVDGYGTGASSIAQLKHICVSSLKIDSSFIKQIHVNPESESIINAAIKMAHCLDLKAIAEDVETEEQLSFLKHLGCDLAQGPYFAEAIDEEEFKKLVRLVS